MNLTTDTQQLLSNNQPITPTDSLQYRAIGRLWGRYVPDQELIYKGQLIRGKNSEYTFYRHAKLENLAVKELHK